MTIIIAALSLVVIVLVAVLLKLVSFFKSLSSSLQETAIKEQKSKAEGYAMLNQSAKRRQTVFAGDSITEGFRITEFFEDFTSATGQILYNRGISGDTSGGLLARWEENVLALEPQNLVLLIGINDIGKGPTPEEVAHNVEEMLQKTRGKCKNTNIILQAVYPINDSLTDKSLMALFGGKKNEVPVKEQLATLNAILRQLAEKYQAAFVDLTNELADKEGNLRADFSNDGVHLNANAYDTVAKRIQPLLVAD